MGPPPVYQFRAAVHIKDGRYRAESSVPAAVNKGTVDDGAAKNVQLTSAGDRFNGLVIEGNSKYRIDGATIDFNGDGGSDFVGYGAGILVKDKSAVDITGTRVNNKGVVRTALWIGGSATVNVSDSTFETRSGVLPPGHKFSINPAEMVESPGYSASVATTAPCW